MTKTTVTAAVARDEIARRLANKGLAPADKTPPACKIAQSLPGAVLAEIAGKPAPATKAPAAPKAARTPEQQAATAARKAAWDWRKAERAEGRKVSYAEACARFGTTPAKAA